jgi:hypothetical protein
VQKCFLLGEGLGAVVAIKSFLIQGLRFWDGCLLLSPTLTFPRRLRPPDIAVSVFRSAPSHHGGLWRARLSIMGCVGLWVGRRYEGTLGTFPLVPFSRVYIDSLHEPSKKQEVMENPLFYRYGMRISTLLQVLDVSSNARVQCRARRARA